MLDFQDTASKFDRLRRQAEDLIQLRPNTVPEKLCDIVELIHELRTHQAELEIQNKELKQIRLLNRQLLMAQEQERQTISCKLLDNIAQNLATLKINCETILNSPSGLETDQQEELLHMSQVLQETLRAVRSMGQDLRPTNLDHFGLVRAVDAQCRHHAQQCGLTIEFSAVGLEELPLERSLSINIYRIVQEALNNIKQHAKADHVFIHLVPAFPNLILRIKDNGQGFDPCHVEHQEEKMGLNSMKARAELL
ncbi:MAG: hypothetical protein K9K64_16225 [Desulfohalobiaceae bacterium]|nr:hypothetical protein [Desulfohalobiaceae bacterium]